MGLRRFARAHRLAAGRSPCDCGETQPGARKRIVNGIFFAHRPPVERNFQHIGL